MTNAAGIGPNRPALSTPTSQGTPSGSAPASHVATVASTQTGPTIGPGGLKPSLKRKRHDSLSPSRADPSALENRPASNVKRVKFDAVLVATRQEEEEREPAFEKLSAARRIVLVDDEFLDLFAEESVNIDLFKSVMQAKGERNRQYDPAMHADYSEFPIFQDNEVELIINMIEEEPAGDDPELEEKGPNFAAAMDAFRDCLKTVPPDFAGEAKPRGLSMLMRCAEKLPPSMNETYVAHFKKNLAVLDALAFEPDFEKEQLRRFLMRLSETLGQRNLPAEVFAPLHAALETRRSVWQTEGAAQAGGSFHPPA